MVQQIIIDVSDLNTQPRVVRWTQLADYYDAGLHTLILSIVQNGLWAVQTLGALHNAINAALQGNNDALLATLDSHSLRLFVDDMQANGFNLSMSDKLLTGKRPPAPVLAGGGNAAVGNVGVVGVTGQIDLAYDTEAIWVLLTPQGAGFVQERLVPVTQDAQGWFTVNAENIPPANYVAKIAAVNSAGLRGFMSGQTNVVTVT